MATERNPHVEAAMQYLAWAIEEVEKTGHQKATHHVRTALDQLRLLYTTDGTSFTKP
ncbi:hypothetical protein JQ615_41370 [Bradyrhizobium jicamae]|uniref:Uncharacterized protein n=1 Tax=Bradyrhizobium jicamae TaxID=280332 RepID=A0ABS5FYD3_9BRAD|nr:hypothetical protein [Bradyrhizobium jicamae]MBR0801792.1 hypothetical protein [Bradyrhizobium jicamae]MBR0938970.1 hypothetical protein [Bradyrhizobium jicamae]